MTKQKQLPRTLLIINPISGMKKQIKLVEEIKLRQDSFNHRYTEYAGHIGAIFEEEYDNYDLFVAVGGDGTFNELASAAVNTSKTIAILPFGSGNGFAREFGFTKKLDDLQYLIDNFEYLNIDSLDINGHVCVNIAGVGIDSEIAHVFHNMKRRGFWSYFFSTVKTLLFAKSINLKIDNEKFNLSGKYMLASISNNRQYGNNAIISPKANPFDGKFELLLVKRLPKIFFPYIAIMIFLGSIRSSFFVQYILNLENIELSSNVNTYHIDGEAVELDNPVRINILKNSLRVLKTKRFR